MGNSGPIHRHKRSVVLCPTDKLAYAMLSSRNNLISVATAVGFKKIASRLASATEGQELDV